MNVYKEWTSRRPWKDRKKAAKERVSVASQLASPTQDPELIYYGKNSGVVGLTRSEIYQICHGSDVLRCGYDKVIYPTFIPLFHWLCDYKVMFFRLQFHLMLMNFYVT